MKESYKKIVEHYEDCLKTHGDNHRGMDWPNLKDAMTRYQVMLSLIKADESSVSCLDFGCGTSHLYQYILDNDIKNINYSGLDLSETFIKLSQEKYPNNNYYSLDILKEQKTLPQFDYIFVMVYSQKKETCLLKICGHIPKKCL